MLKISLSLSTCCTEQCGCFAIVVVAVAIGAVLSGWASRYYSSQQRITHDCPLGIVEVENIKEITWAVLELESHIDVRNREKEVSSRKWACALELDWISGTVSNQILGQQSNITAAQTSTCGNNLLSKSRPWTSKLPLRIRT